jgi:hypothetical protein
MLSEIPGMFLSAVIINPVLPERILLAKAHLQLIWYIIGKAAPPWDEVWPWVSQLCPQCAALIAWAGWACKQRDELISRWEGKNGTQSTE